MAVFEQRSELPVPADVAYAWHARPGALQRLAPPWEPVRVLEQRGGLADGRVVLEVPLGPFRQRWVAQHRGAEPGRQFVDEQVEGPFRRWVHTHAFEPVGANHCRYVDRIEYELPGGAFGALAAGMVRSRLERTFRYRHATLAADLRAHLQLGSPAPMDIAITGSTGLIGRSLVAMLTALGHRVRQLVRRNPGPEDIRWDPAEGPLPPGALEGAGAVIHLAGEPIAGGRWTPAKRRRILESRTRGTGLLAEAIAGMATPPGALLSASAVGIYGDRGDQPLNEEARLRVGPDCSFVEKVGHAWEAATEPAERAGVRVARTRLGIVLSPAGGALAEMLPPFRAGLGGRLGSGRQYTSWIGIDDVLGAIYHTIHTPALSGPVNLTAPTPVTNAQYTAVLARVLRRPAVLPVPAHLLRLIFGELADELLLTGARVIPERLAGTGYGFRHRQLEEALRHVLGR